MFSYRLATLRENLKPNEAFLFSNPTDLAYLCNFECLLSEEREAFFLLTKESSYLIQASFSPSPQDDNLIILKGCSPQHLQNYLRQISLDEKIDLLFIDQDHLTVNEFLMLKEVIDVKSLESQGIWQLRMIKDSLEQENIRIASQKINYLISYLLNSLEIGQTEIEVHKKLLQKMIEVGAETEAFPSIIAFGPHTALPHHQPSNIRLKDDMAVLIDSGIKVNGYRSDMTRTVWFGSKPNPEFIKIEKIAKDAYDAALKKLAIDPVSGSFPTASEVDLAARELISKAGFSHQFNHTTGHGLGLDIHEPPSISSTNHTPLLPSMVITIEPGIYLEGLFGYRYENTVLITQQGPVELTK